MKYFFLSLFILLISFLVFIPSKAQSVDCSDSSFWNSGIVPCGRNCNNTETTADETKPCTLCHLIVGFYDLIKYGLKIVVFVALVCLVIAGIMYIFSAGSEQLITTAKTFIKQVLYGVGFVLAAWLLIFVVMNYLGVNSELGIGSGKNWYTFTCSTESVTGTGSSTPSTGEPDAQGNSNVTCGNNGVIGAQCKKTANCPSGNEIFGTSSSVCETGEVCCGNGNVTGPECGTNRDGMCTKCSWLGCWQTYCSGGNEIDEEQNGCSSGYICCKYN